MRAKYSSLCAKCASSCSYIELWIQLFVHSTNDTNCDVNLTSRHFIYHFGPCVSQVSNSIWFRRNWAKKKEYRNWVYRLQNGKEMYWLSIYVCWLAIFLFKKLSFSPFQTVYWIHSMPAVKFWISLRESFFSPLLTKTFFCHWIRRRVEV